jgi:hypothetical protein
MKNLRLYIRPNFFRQINKVTVTNGKINTLAHPDMADPNADATYLHDATVLNKPIPDVLPHTHENFQSSNRCEFWLNTRIQNAVY